ncbi:MULTISPECIES: exonuclease SbcCD subunit D [unclassified Streptomyces]|uniref:exonuclease SbcCD subunit D n=1 Tax=unclassified Streptomyces TaxID=2593676 RepID=UPI0006B034D5|nr:MULTISPECIES: exonuclease SbcCD subunit D [unclassified Streptomyces]KOX35615.1 exonuclease SbcD [Streptomyces sp. NRRL F-6491]KOX37769.1 exonuclease SbcD [Streptomyces sp. NRRL F-6492]
MRILHTSDWHLGRQLHRVPLIDEQRAFLRFLVDTVREHRVDVVTVAGDVFDRAIPPLDAIGLFDQVLEELAGMRVPLVMISGNHDSPRRLGVNARLIERAGIHLRTSVDDCARPAVLNDEHGPVAFYGLPYLEPGLVQAHFETEKPSHEAVLGAAMDQVRADLATRPGTRSVVLAHAFVTGAEPSDSERDITAGGVSSVSASVFDGTDYVALGHLHRCQKITDRVRYSGSPLAYSFSEVDHPKAMWLVDLDAQGRLDDQRIPCPVPRTLGRLTGTLDALLADPEHTELERSWLHITLTDPDRPHMAMERLKERFPHTLRLSFTAEHHTSDESYATRVNGRSDHDIALGFLHHVTNVPATAQEQDLLREGLESVRVQAAAREAH